jgi:hypothetical protein
MALSRVNPDSSRVNPDSSRVNPDSSWVDILVNAAYKVDNPNPHDKASADVVAKRPRLGDTFPDMFPNRDPNRELIVRIKAPMNPKNPKK